MNNNLIVKMGSLALIMLMAPATLTAEVISGYIGEMSFHLTDDRELWATQTNATSAKEDYARLDESKEQMGSQLVRLNQQIEANQSEMKQVESQIDALQKQRDPILSQITELKKDEVKNKDEILAAEKKVADLDTKIKATSVSLGQLKLQLAPLNVQREQISNDFKIVETRTADARNRMMNAQRQYEYYHDQLIAEIQKANRDGALRGEYDGQNDGVSLAYNLGLNNGQKDGSTDGYADGMTAGKNRDYKIGLDKGVVVGNRRGQ